MVHYKLVYFELRGFGENIRQIFAYAGQEYEDFRQPKETWKTEMKHKTPFGTLPVLYVDGKPLSESHAISRYLARQFGIAGKDSWEEGQVDSIADVIKDYQVKTRKYGLTKQGFSEGDAEKIHKEEFLPALEKASKICVDYLKANGSGYLVGDSLTWVDLLIAENTANLLGDKVNLFQVNATEYLEKYPELNTHQKKIHSIPSIKKWIETRPFSPF